MNIRTRFPSSVLITATLLGVACGLPHADAEVMGQVQYVHGSVSFEADAHAAPALLDPRKSVGLTVTDRSLLRCGPGGVVTVRRPHGGPFVLAGPSPWTPLPHLLPVTPTRAQIAMEDYARAGGRDRAEKNALFCPAPLSVVDPQDLTFRWTPQLGLQTFSLVVRSLDGRVLWQQRDISGQAGELASRSARAALGQAAASRLAAVVLTLTDQDRRVQRFRFGLLAPAEQSALRRDLTAWDAKPELIRYLGRAAVFARYGMDNAAADEFDAAQALAPNDPALLDLADTARKTIGRPPTAQGPLP